MNVGHRAIEHTYDHGFQRCPAAHDARFALRPQLAGAHISHDAIDVKV